MAIKDEAPRGYLSSRKSRDEVPGSNLDKLKFEGCGKKQFYDDWWSATHAAALARERAGHENIYAYKCRYCPGHHVGHRRQKNGNKVVES